MDTKYPKATIREIMEIREVKDGTDVLEGYEVVMMKADENSVEITVTADGKVLEEGKGDES